MEMNKLKQNGNDFKRNFSPNMVEIIYTKPNRQENGLGENHYFRKIALVKMNFQIDQMNDSSISLHNG